MNIPIRPDTRLTGKRGEITNNALMGIVILVALAGSLIYALTRTPDTSNYLKVELSYEGPPATRLVKDARPASFNIYFSDSAAALDSIGKPVTSGITMSPSLDGKWVWVNDRRLSFTPKDDWGVGTEYIVDLDRSLFPEHVLLDDYRVRFGSEPFTGSVVSSEFYQDPIDPREKRVVATLRFSHPVDPVTLRDRITLRFQADPSILTAEGKTDYGFTVTYDEFKGEAYINSEPVSLPLHDAYMKLEVAPGVASSRGGRPTAQKLETSVLIPSAYTYFKITSTNIELVRNEEYEPEQSLIIENTAGVLESVMNPAVQAWLLPKDKPATSGGRVMKNYQWKSSSEVTPDVLKLSRKIDLDPIPAEHEYSKLHSYRLDLEAGRFLYVKVDKGIKSFGDYVLAEEFARVIRVPEYTKELEIMHDGALLSLGGEKKLSVMSRGIEAVRFSVGRVLTGDINHLVSQNHGSFKDPYFYYNFDKDNVTERFTEVQRMKPLPPNKTQYTAFDFSRYLSGSAGGNSRLGLFFLDAESWDPDFERTTGKRDSRFILITDMGLLVKKNADGTHDVFVMSIERGTPVPGAKVDVLGLNGVPVVTRTTGGDGHVTIPSLKGFELEQQPVAFLATKGSDVSFIPFETYDRRLNFSRFDVGGERTGGKEERLNAFLFSDRGIYRPGDEFHIGMIVRSNDWGKEVAGIPLEAAVSDPRGLTVMKRKLTLGAAGFEEVSYRTEESSPTGEYNVRLYVIKDNKSRALLGSTTVKVEEFLPDRMKIRTTLSAAASKGWISPFGLKGHVALTNLYGTPATGRTVRATIDLRPAQIYFSQFKEYTFYDSLKSDKSFNERLKETNTDDKGEAEFDLGLERYEKATYRLVFEAEGFEAEGGRSVSSVSTAIVSPLEFMVGYKPDGSLRYMKRDTERSVGLIAVDPKLTKIARQGLTARLVELRYVSVLKKQDDGRYRYESEEKEIFVKDDDLGIPVEGTTLRLDTSNPGEFALHIQDEAGVDLNIIRYSVVGEGNLTRSLERNAELQVKLNKPDFRPGEEIEVSIKAPYTGAGLITIERDRVYAYKWFKTVTNGTVQKITLPKDMEGRGYVNVSFVRAAGSDEVFMSPLSYGVEPFSVSLDDRTAKIDIDSPDRAAPGQPYVIKYKGNVKGKAVVFAVDEGILQVARYTTPDPLSYFFRKRALEVDTYQILDLILPEFSAVKNLSAEGGGSYDEAAGKNLNPFKRKREVPVAYWSGIVDIGPESRELVYEVPDHFSGTLRVMAVAVSSDKVGAAEKKATIKGPFVISPNAPTFAAPGDEFIVSANVANEVEGSGESAKVRLSLETDGGIEILDGGVRDIDIPEGTEKSATFKVRAKDVLGNAEFRFTASIGTRSAKRSATMSIRPPGPLVTTQYGGYVSDGKAAMPVSRVVYPQFRDVEVSVSHMPLSLAGGLANYLSNYPHLCTEQLMSQAIPALALSDVEGSGYVGASAEATIKNAMRILMSRQNADGSFGMWYAGGYSVPFHAVYAVNFLTEAKEHGYPVDEEMLGKALEYLKKLAADQQTDMNSCRIRAYAIYLLARNGFVTTGYAMDLKGLLEKAHKGEWESDTAGIYLAGTFKLLKLDADARKIASEFEFGRKTVNDYNYYYSGLLRDAQMLYVLSLHFPDRAKEVSNADLMHIVRPVTSNHYNTTSSAYCILALKAFAESGASASDGKIIVDEVYEDGSKHPLATSGKLVLNGIVSEKAKKVVVGSESSFNLYFQLTETGYDKALPESIVSEGMEVQREYRDEKGNAVTSARIGETLTVHLKFRTINRGYTQNIAVVDLLPGGFDPVIEEGIRRNALAPTRDRDGRYIQVWSPDYVDIREDRVIAYGSADRNLKEFVYRIKATNRGTYSIPPAYGEAMYDPEVRARSLGGKFVVE